MRDIHYNDLEELESAVAGRVRVLENGCLRGGSLSLTTRDITLKECRMVTTLKYLLRKLFNRLHYILNDPRTFRLFGNNVCVCVCVR